MALSADRDTPRRTNDSIYLGVAAAVKIYAGALVARDASGNATPGAASTTILGVGRAAEQVDNSSGAANALYVQVEKGTFKYANSSTAAITDANIGADCYIEDDQTVSRTNQSSTLSVAGKIVKVDSDGVWVEFR